MPERNRRESVDSVYPRCLNSLETLAADARPLQLRLEAVMVDGIGHLQSSDFPADLRRQFEEIESSMEGAGSWAQSARQMSDQGAETLAKKIFELTFEVIRRDAIEAGE